MNHCLCGAAHDSARTLLTALQKAGSSVNMNKKWEEKVKINFSSVKIKKKFFPIWTENSD